MPSTYTLISSNVLSSSAASVTFSAIPSTYTDLVIRLSARSDTDAGVRIRFNNSSSALSSRTYIMSDTTAPFSSQNTSETYTIFPQASNVTSDTANTFSNSEIYIPNYTAATNKPVSGSLVKEFNSSSNGTAQITASANLWRDTTAISSIVIMNAGNYVSGSSFYLYGIKNS
jgi:hypothetical protein